jgi:hypothetical protein
MEPVPLGLSDFLLRRAVDIKHPPQVREAGKQKKEVRPLHRRAPRASRLL